MYLDVETTSPGYEKEVTFRNIKVILIVVKIVKEDIKIWKEWEIGERNVIKSFYDFLLEFKEPIRIIGFNIHGFDEPLLKLKAIEYKVMDTYTIFDLWRRICIIDLCRTLLPLNEFKFKGLYSENVYNILLKICKKYKN